MNKEKESGGAKHIVLAIFTGLSIVIMAWFSKKVLPEPLSYLELALPPFLATLGEGLWQHEKTGPRMKTWYPMAAVVLSTAAIILVHYPW